LATSHDIDAGKDCEIAAANAQETGARCRRFIRKFRDMARGSQIGTAVARASRRLMVPKARKRSRGFTIIELMIALVIIGIMAATVAPALSEVLADNRQTSAAMDVVRTARQARAQAISTGLAHLLRYRNSNDKAGAFGLGTIAMYVGLNSKCRQTPWGQAFAPAVNSNQGPVHILHMREYNPTDGDTDPQAGDDNRHVITAVSQLRDDTTAALAQTLICYQPNGEIYTGAAYVNPSSLVPQVDPVLITIGRTFNGVRRGQNRQVLFPVGGNARLR
jgi:prepilin-type N-terminal cleavage/methylation domain-containing protein